MSSINQPSLDGSFWKGLRRRSVTPTRISRRSRYFSFSFLEPTIDEISQDRNDLFSAIVSAKDGVIEEIRSLPGMLQNFAPLLQGLGNFN